MRYYASRKKVYLFILPLLILSGCDFVIHLMGLGEEPRIVWQQTNLEDIHVVTLAIDENGVIYASPVGLASNLRLYRSNDHGISWTLLNTPDIRGYIEIISICRNGDIYASYNNGMNGGLVMSTDQGECWSECDIPSMSIKTIAIHSEDHIFIGCNKHEESPGGIFYSTDHGVNWNHTPWPLSQGVNALAFDSQDFLLIYSNNQLNRSTDNGQTWTEIFHDTLLSGCFRLALKTDHLMFRSTRNKGIFRSINGGASWQQTSLNDLILPPLCLSDDGMIITAGSRLDGEPGGIFYSVDDGENWIDITGNLRNEPVDAIAYSPNGDIFVGTYSRGVMKINRSVLQ